MSEREQRYWGPYPGEVPLSRASRPTPTPLARPEAVPPPPVAAPGDDAPDPAPDPDVLARVPERAPTRAERRRDGTAMVPILAQALSTQLLRLAADADPLPDGWWFTPRGGSVDPAR